MTGERVVQLTAQQLAAVEHTDGRIFLVASPGSGKTEVLTRRTVHVLQGGQSTASRILAVTYTVRAATQLRARVQVAAREDAWRVDASTLHAFALDWLRRFGASVGVSSNPVVLADDADRLSVVAEYLRSLGQPDPLEHDRNGLREALGRIDTARNAAAVDLDAITGTFLGVPLRELYEAYTVALEAADAIDFPGMLLKFIELFESDPWQRENFCETYTDVMVDEGQDLTLAQSEVLMRLGQPPVRLFVVADARQSINRFAGGGFQNAERLFDSQSTYLALDHNFRCARRIIEAAEALMKGEGTVGMTPAGHAPPGSIEVRGAADRLAEAVEVRHWIEGLLEQGLDEAFLTPGEDPRVSAEEIAVLGRARWHLDEIVSTLRVAGVSVSVQAVGGSGLFRSPGGRVAVDGLAIVANEKDRPALRRLAEELAGLGVSELQGGPLASLATSGVAELQRLGECLRRVAAGATGGVMEVAEALRQEADSAEDGDRLAELLTEYELETPVRHRELKGFVRFLQRRQQTRPSDPGVRAITVHGAKGLEFKAVVIVGAYDGAFPDYRAQDPSAVQDERRAFYVAMTRAARSLLVTWPERTIDGYGRLHTQTPSRFLREAGLMVT